MTTGTAETGAKLPPHDDLVRQLAADVLQTAEDPYPELEAALSRLVCIIQGLPCASTPSDWPQVIAEAISLRPVHG